MFSAAKKRVDVILNHNDSNNKGIEPIISDIHKEYNYLPHEVMIYLAYKLNTSHSAIYNAAKNAKLQ